MHMLHLEAMGQGPTVGTRRRFLDKAKLVGEELAGASGRKLRPGEGDGVWLELTQRWRAEETGQGVVPGRMWGEGERGARSQTQGAGRGAVGEESRSTRVCAECTQHTLSAAFLLESQGEAHVAQ